MSAPAKTAEEIAAEEAEAAAEAAAAADAETTDTDADAEAALGDKGKQALDRMKAERKALREELARFKGLGLAPDALKDLISKSESDSQAAAAALAQSAAESAALSKANERLVRAEVKAAATGKLANPALALRLLDTTTFEVNDDGEVDSDAIASAIDDLIKKEPYLAAQGGKRFEGGADAGHKGSAGKPQLTEADVKKLAAAGKHDEIEQARIEGRLNTLLGIS